MGLNVNNKLWLISDTHFGHSNIVKFQQRPASHEVIMLSEWVRLVRENDQILHMGDVVMGKQGNPKKWAALISRMPGEKFLILGNHDKQNLTLYTDVMGFKIVKPFVRNGFAFTHEPISIDFPLKSDVGWHTNIHGHTHGNFINPDHDGLIYENKHYINVCVEVTNFKPVQLGTIWN